MRNAAKSAAITLSITRARIHWRRKICVKMGYGRDFEASSTRFRPYEGKILAMRVTTQFICVLLNLHVKEARRTTRIFTSRRIFRGFLRGISGKYHDALSCHIDKWISILPLRSRPSFGATLHSPDLILKREIVVSKVAQLSLSSFRDFARLRKFAEFRS